MKEKTGFRLVSSVAGRLSRSALGSGYHARPGLFNTVNWDERNNTASDMKQLEETFRKNGLNYQLIKRNDNVALFELLFDGECVGWEVSRIYHQKEKILNDRHYQESEVLPGNEKFGTEGSQAFHKDGRDKAEMYFDILTNGLKMSNSLESIRLEARSAFRRGITSLRGYYVNGI